MLVVLAKNVSNCNIPDSILDTTTFEDDESSSPITDGSLSGTLASQDITDVYDAMYASMKAGRERSTECTTNSPDSGEDDEAVFEDCVELL